LADLTNVEKLSLAHPQISDVSPLANLKNLKSLSLWYTQVRDVQTAVTLVESIVVQPLLLRHGR
jgi:Leucine-rich repeat (LRR) protein